MPVDAWLHYIHSGCFDRFFSITTVWFCANAAGRWCTKEKKAELIKTAGLENIRVTEQTGQNILPKSVFELFIAESKSKIINKEGNNLTLGMNLPLRSPHYTVDLPLQPASKPSQPDSPRGEETHSYKYWSLITSCREEGVGRHQWASINAALKRSLCHKSTFTPGNFFLNHSSQCHGWLGTMTKMGRHHNRRKKASHFNSNHQKYHPIQHEIWAQRKKNTLKWEVVASIIRFSQFLTLLDLADWEHQAQVSLMSPPGHMPTGTYKHNSSETR